MMETSVFNGGRGNRSPITAAWVEALRNVPEGGVIRYSELAAIVHAEVSSHYGFLYTARAIAEREHGMVFVVDGQSLRRLRNDEIPDYANKLHHRKLVKDTERYRVKVQAVDEERLNQSARNNYQAACAFISLRESISSDPVRKQIQKSSANPAQLMDKDVLLGEIASMWK